MTDYQGIFVFIGEHANALPAGIFTSYEKAVNWISENELSGLLNHFPVDIGLYDWAIEMGYFTPRSSEKYGNYQFEPDFKQKFNSASIDHWHFEDGKLA